MASALPLRSALMRNNAFATLATVPGSLVFSMITPFAPSLAAFLRMDLYIFASSVQSASPLELRIATSSYGRGTCCGVRYRTTASALMAGRTSCLFITAASVDTQAAVGKDSQ